MFQVIYIINKSGEKITKSFSSPYQCKLLVNKLKHSKNCTLVSYPNVVNDY